MPLYGRTFTLSNPKNNGPNAPATGAGTPGPYSREAGVLVWNEICTMLQNGNWTTQWDDDFKAPYMYKGNQWVAFDNKDSLTYKVKYLVNTGLGGTMVWSIDGDDFNNVCDGGHFPLLTHIGETLRNTIAEKEEEDKRKAEECEQSMIDCTPVISQFKSLFQAIFGDVDGAKQTQENFSRCAVIVSQFRSAVEAAGGDEEAARKSQLCFIKNIEAKVDQTPLIGHIKGAVHYSLGDDERGDEIMKDASRNTIVLSSMAACGPLCALSTGIFYDVGVTAIESIKMKNYTPYGIFRDSAEFDNMDVGNRFDVITSIIGDVVGRKKSKNPKSNGNNSVDTSKSSHGSTIRRTPYSTFSESHSHFFNPREPTINEFRQNFDLFVNSLQRQPDVNEFKPFSPTNSNPISRVLYRQIGGLKRIEAIEANIYSKHAIPPRTRKEFSTEVKNYYNQYLGPTDDDQMGHLVRASLGGPSDWYNLVPQEIRVNANWDTNPQFRETSWFRAENWMDRTLKKIKSEASSDHVLWRVAIDYIDGKNGRPIKFRFQAERVDPSGNVVDAFVSPGNWNHDPALAPNY